MITIIKESSDNEVICYRTVGWDEFDALLAGETIKGKYDNNSEGQNDSNLKDVVCFFREPIMWQDKEHIFMIKCKFNSNEVYTGSGVYYASKDLRSTNIWTGRRGKTEYNLDEIYVKSYNLKNVIAFVVKNEESNPLSKLQKDLEDGEYMLNIYKANDYTKNDKQKRIDDQTKFNDMIRKEIEIINKLGIVKEGLDKMIKISEAKENSTDDVKIINIQARDFDNNIEKMLNCVKDLSMAGHTFDVVVDPDAENVKERTFEIDGDGCDQLIEINTEVKSNDEEQEEQLEESLGDVTINDVVKLYNELKSKGLSKDEIIKEIEKLDNESLTEAIENGIKVTLFQKLAFDYSTDVEQYEGDNDFVLDNLEIDEDKIALELLKYFKSYSYNDEFKDTYNMVNRVDVDFENDSIKVYLVLSDKSITDEKIKYVFDDFIKDVVLEDEQLSGSTEIEVEPFDSEPYEAGYDGYHETIQYESSVIDEIEVDYNFTTVGEQTIEIER